MKKFKFKFERLLKIRKFEEREEQFKFASVLGKYLNTKDIIDKSNDLRGKFLLNSKKYVKVLDIEYLKVRDKSRTGLMSKIKVYKNILKEQQFLVEREREVLIDISKKKKTLEILKEKEFERYKKEVEKVENAELDEIGSNIFIKNKTRELPEKGVLDNVYKS